jgi:hypothetical protein
MMLIMEHELHQAHVEPPAEFAADFSKRSDLDKAEAFVEMAAGVAPLSDTSQQRVEAIAARFGDNRRLERATDSPAAKRGFDIKRRLGRFVVRGTLGEAAQRGPPHDLVGEHRNQDGIPPAVILKPRQAVDRRFRFDVKRRRRGQDRLVVDLGNGSEIASSGGPDFDGIGELTD